MSEADRQGLFDAWAAGYDRAVHARDDFPFAGYAEVLAAIAATADPATGGTVLDIGTGTGTLAEHFSDAGCAVTGVDFSAEMLKRARERLPAATLVQADLTGDLSELSGRFDAVVSAYVLHEFPLAGKVRLLRRLADDHLTPGGRLVIGDVAFPTAELRAGAAARWADRWDAEEHYWAADESLPALADAGLAATYDQISICAGVYTITPEASG